MNHLPPQKKTRFKVMFPILVFVFMLSRTLGMETGIPRETRSIYETLKAHGLPMGLLPNGVTEYTVDETGRFEAHLEQACNAKFESELHYDRNVSGILSFGQIGSLTGISAQELFLWFPVKGIRVDVPSSGLIYFDVGVVFKQFTVSLFETPKDCTAVKEDIVEEVENGKIIVETLSKNRKREIRYRDDEDQSGIDSL